MLLQSGWPSGLRRCVQVAVSPGGVGSNPTSDNNLFPRTTISKHCIFILHPNRTENHNFHIKEMKINKQNRFLKMCVKEHNRTQGRMTILFTK